MRDRDPFAVEDETSVYVPRPASERALGQMELALAEGRPVVALSGPPGIGKSILLRVLGRRMDKQACCVFPDPDVLTAEELFMWIVRELDARETLDAERNIPNRSTLVKFREWMRREWQDADTGNAEDGLLKRARDLGNQGFPVIALVDDADALTPKTIKRLTDVGEASGRSLCFALALTSGPLAEPVISALPKSGLHVDYSEPLSAAETSQYVQERLRKAGAQPELMACIDDARARRIYAYSQGIPRRIHGELSLLHIELSRVRAGVRTPGERTAADFVPVPLPAAAPQPIEVESVVTLAPAVTPVAVEAVQEVIAAAPVAEAPVLPPQSATPTPDPEPAEAIAQERAASNGSDRRQRNRRRSRGASAPETQPEVASEIAAAAAAPAVAPDLTSEELDSALSSITPPAPEAPAAAAAEPAPAIEETAEPSEPAIVVAEQAADAALIEAVKEDWANLSERSVPLAGVRLEAPAAAAAPEATAAPAVAGSEGHTFARALLAASAQNQAEEREQQRLVPVSRARVWAAGSVAALLVVAAVTGMAMVLGSDSASNESRTSAASAANAASEQRVQTPPASETSRPAESSAPKPAAPPPAVVNRDPAPVGSAPAPATVPAPAAVPVSTSTSAPTAAPERNATSTPASEPARKPAPAPAAAPVKTHKVRIQASPYADIAIDSKYVGQTPLTVVLSEGAHEVRAKMRNGQTKLVPIEVKDDDMRLVID